MRESPAIFSSTASFRSPWPMANTSHRARCRASRISLRAIACRAPPCAAHCTCSSRKAAFFVAAAVVLTPRQAACTARSRSMPRRFTAMRRLRRKIRARKSSIARRWKCRLRCRPRIPSWASTSFAVQRMRSEMASRSSSRSPTCPRRRPSATAFAAAAPRPRGLEKLAKDVRGVQQVTTAVAADAIASKQLKVAIGAPLLRVRAALSDANGDLLAVDEMLLRPDRAHLQDTLARDRAGKSRQRWQLKSA